MPLHSISQKLPAVIYAAKANKINPTQSQHKNNRSSTRLRFEKQNTKRLANMQGIEGVASIARPRYAEQKQLIRNDR